MLSKGGFLTFMMMLSLTVCPTVVTTIWGTAFLICSADVFVISPGNDTSSLPAWSAEIRVPRFSMTT